MKTLLYTSIACFITLFTMQGNTQDKNNEPDHDKYLGKIVFSDQEIDLSKYETKENFDLSDNLHALAIMNKTLEESYEKNNYSYDFDNNKYTYNYALRMKVDGEEYTQWYFELPEPLFSNAQSLEYVLTTKEKKMKRLHSDIINEWVEAIAGLNSGKHEIYLEIVPLNLDVVADINPVLASGSFTLEVGKGKQDEFLKQRTTGLPPATIINSTLEEKILKASNAVYMHAKPLRAYITDRKQDWSYVRDDYGDVYARFIIASVIYKTHASDKCWVKSAFYSQDHQGYGEYDNMDYYKSLEGYYDYRIPCWKVPQQQEEVSGK